MRNPSSYDYCSPQEWADALRAALFDAFADRDLQALFSREEIQERFSRFLPELERQEDEQDHDLFQIDKRDPEDAAERKAHGVAEEADWNAYAAANPGLEAEMRREGWKFSHSIYSNRADSLAYALDPWNTLRSLRDEALE
jgi:hypothetical protein